MATKLEGGGGKALVAGPIKKTFFAASRARRRTDHVAHFHDNRNSGDKTNRCRFHRELESKTG